MIRVVGHFSAFGADFDAHWKMLLLDGYLSEMGAPPDEALAESGLQHSAFTV